MDGCCTNGLCYEAKTGTAVEAIVEQLRQDVPHVRVVEAGDSSAVVELSPDEVLGVGEDQYETGCKACGNFGATVSLVAGEEGKICRSACLDPACYKKHVALRLRAEKTGAVIKDTKEGVETKGKKKATAGKSGKPNVVSERVKEYRRKMWNVAVKSAITAGSSNLALCFLLDLMISGKANHIDGVALRNSFQDIAGTDGAKSVASVIVALDSADRAKIAVAAAASAIEKTEDYQLKKVADFFSVKFSDWWKIDETFLGLLTKSEIEAVCKEIEVDGLVPDYKKVMTGKKEDAIKSILAAEFDFDGVVPSVMTIS